MTVPATDNLIKACRLDALSEDEPVCVEIDGHPSIAVYLYQGKVYATQNLCTHGNALLTDGYQDGRMIECPFHGGAFDLVTGAATSAPCKVPLKVYEVTTRDGWVFLSV